MKKFLREKFLFLIDKDQKEYVRQKIMDRNHKVLLIFLGVLAILELFYLVLSLLGVDNSTNANVESAYRVLYSFLFVICLSSILLLRYFQKKRKVFQYFLVVSIFTFSAMLWGAGMSILASFDSFTFLYYVLVMVAASALICLEPWVEFLCVIIATIAYVVLSYTLPGVNMIEPSLFISVLLLTVAIVLICFFYNFFTRVNAIFLEYEINNLNTVLEDKANTDKLTGVNNRLFLSEKLEQTADDDLTNVGIMMIDLDNFKLINDNYGHLAGDKCLSEIGRLIRDIINNKDAYCVRYGGEEFLVHFTNISKKELFDLAEKLRKVVEKNEVEIKENTKIKYTISIGLALGKDSKSYNSMINQSDKALYLAKETRNSTKFVA